MTIEEIRAVMASGQRGWWHDTPTPGELDTLFAQQYRGILAANREAALRRQTTPPRELLNVKAAAQSVSCTEIQLRWAIQRGRVSVISQSGRKRLVDLEEVRKWRSSCAA